MQAREATLGTLSEVAGWDSREWIELELDRNELTWVDEGWRTQGIRCVEQDCVDAIRSALPREVTLADGVLYAGAPVDLKSVAASVDGADLPGLVQEGVEDFFL